MDQLLASDDHPGGSFWIYAHPFASKKEAEVLTAMQTIVGQVNSEFQEMSREKFVWELSADFTETQPGRSVEER